MRRTIDLNTNVTGWGIQLDGYGGAAAVAVAKRSALCLALCEAARFDFADKKFMEKLIHSTTFTLMHSRELFSCWDWFTTLSTE